MLDQLFLLIISNDKLILIVDKYFLYIKRYAKCQKMELRLSGVKFTSSLKIILEIKSYIPILEIKFKFK